MITTSDIRKGLCIRYSNDIYKIIEFLHVKPGKAFQLGKSLTTPLQLDTRLTMLEWKIENTNSCTKMVKPIIL